MLKKTKSFILVFVLITILAISIICVGIITSYRQVIHANLRYLQKEDMIFYLRENFYTIDQSLISLVTNTNVLNYTVSDYNITTKIYKAEKLDELTDFNKTNHVSRILVSETNETTFLMNDRYGYVMVNTVISNNKRAMKQVSVYVLKKKKNYDSILSVISGY
ncbi:hypothetical protein ACFL6D_02885 [Spirochaetota bacterium]